MLASDKDQATLTIRFVSGQCVDGIDYGPRHCDRPVTMPAYRARWFLQRGVARVERSHVVEVVEEVQEEPEPEIEPEPEPEVVKVPQEAKPKNKRYRR